MAQVNPYLKELLYFLKPIILATRDLESLKAYLDQFGIELDASSIQSFLNEIGSLTTELNKLANDTLPQDDEAIDYGKALFSLLNNFSNNQTLNSLSVSAETFAIEIFDSLLFQYLTSRLPFFCALLKALGVITEITKKASETGRSKDYTCIQFNWQRLGEFIRDNRGWAKSVYGWGDNFNYDLALQMLSMLIDESQIALAYKKSISNPDQFLSNTKPNETYHEVCLPLIQDTLQDFDTDNLPIFANEAGIKVLPIGDLNHPENLGLALTPYAKGNLQGELSLIDPPGKLKLKYEVGMDSSGGAFIAMKPDGIQMAADISNLGSDLEFEFGIIYEDKDPANGIVKPIILIGDEDATRVQVNSILGAFGGFLSTTSTPDFYVAGGFKGLVAYIDLSDDGFLGGIIPEPIEIKAGDILMGWRTGRGVYFEGGTNLTVLIPLDLDLGPILIYEIGLALDWEENLETTAMITAEARLGPLYAYVREAGLVLTLVPAPNDDGVIGKYNIDFGFKPPSGYAIALDISPIEGGGALDVYDNEYRGALALKFQSFGFSAFGILNTQLPGGKEDFSLAASIFGEFNLPLGYGFFLTGLGGIIGINRSIDTDAMRTVLYEGRFDNLLFPSDPIANARTILDDMAAILPSFKGQYLCGPVARIGWGQPILVDVKLGVVLEVGQFVRILIFGGLGCNLPTKESALIALNLSFFGEIDFVTETISFDATLANSRVLTWAISGDVAIRTGWAPRIEHVASFGGLHPLFPRPSNLPDLRRLSINFGTNNPKLTLSAYQAVTMNSLLFGARADLYAKGPKIWLVGEVAAEGWAYFDTLIYFNPFAFDVGLGGSLALLVDGDRVCTLGFNLRLTGPNTYIIDGNVWVTVFGVDVEFPISHTWGSRQSLPTATINAVEELRKAIQESKGFEIIAPRGRSSGVSFRDADDVETAVDPIGGVRFVQRAMPLGVEITKIGEARLTSPASLDFNVFDSNGNNISNSLDPAHLDFVRGHFFPLTESERLRSVAFESYKAGFEISADELVTNGQEISSEYEYEVIRIPGEDTRQDLLTMVTPSQTKWLPKGFSGRYMSMSHEAVRPRESYKDLLTPDLPVKLDSQGYIGQIVANDALSVANDVDSFNSVIRENLMTLSEAVHLQEDQLRTEANDTIANYIAAAGIRS